MAAGASDFVGDKVAVEVLVLLHNTRISRLGCIHGTDRGWSVPVNRKGVRACASASASSCLDGVAACGSGGAGGGSRSGVGGRSGCYPEVLIRSAVKVVLGFGVTTFLAMRVPLYTGTAPETGFIRGCQSCKANEAGLAEIIVSLVLPKAAIEG